MPRKHKYILINRGNCSVVDRAPEHMETTTACRLNAQLAAKNEPHLWVEARFIVKGVGQWPSLTIPQRRQIEFLDGRERRESGGVYHYEVSCHDCDDDLKVHAAITAKDFIRKHSGHRTWVQYFGKTRVG